MVIKGLAVIIAGIFGVVGVVAQDKINTGETPREAVLFGMRDGITSVNLSPDGKNVVFVAASKGRQSIAMVVPVTGGKPTQVAYSNGAPFRLTWCDWANDSRLICQLYAISDQNQRNINQPFSRLMAFGIDGSNVVDLTIKTRRGFYADQLNTGNVIAWLNDKSALIERAHLPEKESFARVNGPMHYGLAVDRVDLDSGKSNNVEYPDKNAVTYLADGEGAVRVRGEWVENRPGSKEVYSIRYTVRSKGSEAWQQFSVVADGEDFSPIAVADDGMHVYATRTLNGRDALYRVSLDGAKTAELLMANDRVDIDGLIRLGRKGRVIGVTWATDKREVLYFDKELDALAGRLSKAVAGSAIRFASASADEQKLLIETSSDTNPGRYYVFDRATKQLDELMDVRPLLASMKLAAVKPVSYKATDGTMIPGYLTLPPGVTSPGGLPAIVMPHGGPSARDEWGFDWLAQYYAARGYAVLQPNYRGSSGFGDDWYVNNGFQSWDVAMADINAGARWMIDQKIADPDKMAIVGWSYGGYAALQGSVVDPNLYKAIVAIAPVTDLEYLVTDSRRLWNDAKGVRNFVGSGPHIAAGSPRRHAAKIAAPVLLISGDDDMNVNIRHARDMEKALKQAGKKVELVEYRDLDHQIPDSDARIDMLQRSDAFLRQAMKL